MTQPGTPGWGLPRGGDWIAKELAELRAAIDRLSTARGIEASSISGGGITVGGGGAITVEDASGDVLMVVGVDPTNPDVIALQTRRPDGTILLGSFSAGFGGARYTQICDYLGGPVVQDDAFLAGLARPRVPIGQWAPNSAPGSPEPMVTSAAWTTVAIAQGYDQMPKVIAGVRVLSDDAATTGQVQILDPTGAVIGAPVAIPPGAVTDLELGPVTLPNYTRGTRGSWQLQVQRTAGTGSVSARAISLWGCAALDSE